MADQGKQQITAAFAVLLLVVLGLGAVLLIRSPAEPTLARTPEVRLQPPVEPVPLQPWDPSDEQPVTAERIDKALAMAADYLVRGCDERGRFTYCTNLDPSVEVKPAYNIVRHTGAVYALALYARRHPNEPLLDALRRSARFLREEGMGPVEGHDGLLTVWSRPEMEFSDRPLKAHLGGAGLGLAALVCVERVAPGTTPLEELRGLARFVLFMTEDDGRTFTEYIPSEGGRSGKRTVLYYPGEAALGLALLYGFDPSDEWLEGASRILGYLAKQREGQSRVDPDHWALLATAPLLQVYGVELPVSRDVLVRHGAQICERLLSDRAAQLPTAVTYGAFFSNGCTCPTATRLEGLLAALTFLHGDEHAALRARIALAGRDGIAFLLRAQISEGPAAGAIPGGIARFPEGHRRHSAKLNAAITEVRIDYLQHAMSAMMTYTDTVLADETK